MVSRTSPCGMVVSSLTPLALMPIEGLGEEALAVVAVQDGLAAHAGGVLVLLDAKDYLHLMLHTSRATYRFYCLEIDV